MSTTARRPARRLPAAGAAPCAGLLVVAATMSEATLEGHVQTIVNDLRKTGFAVLRYHTWRSVRSESGFPDDVITGPRGTLFRELKTEKGKPTKAQQEWLDTLTAAGNDVALWRPSDLLTGRIAREIVAVARH